MTNEETDRMNRNVADVFWIRHGRDPDWTDPEDRIRLDAIMDWQCRGARSRPWTRRGSAGGYERGWWAPS
jgi:hypothetical protein